ncbi:HesA/MoeB/ThiF family protein [Flavobacterium sp. '19STA2R22 D10 B1']|uniref:HesA/MoeB/ThiF family protein n=1 Tax=Flavobacterium aerium TaxID=3037261 RepID=UPI00278C6150|nr:HesA/MoeB/ThiF family protein [Flavobacterium sp. '19STA2R22 D10 B1']
MLTTQEEKLYDRQLILPEIGEIGQLKLKNARVLVIGAGGLGCSTLPYLVGAGIGNIGIVDHDTIDVSNLHRQLLYSFEDIGKNKAIIARNVLLKKNPYLTITAYDYALTSQNATSIFAHYDIIVDGSDNFATRYLINDTAIHCNKSVVFGSIFKFEGQVTVFNYKNGPSYRCLFPSPPPIHLSPSCAEIGVLGVLPGIIGSIQANEVIKIVCEIGTVLSGKLFVINCLTLQNYILNFQKTTNGLPHESDTFQELCSTSSIDHEISIVDFTQLNPATITVVDVRTPEERLESAIDSLHFPLSTLEADWNQIPTHLPIVFYCQSGVRSTLALHFFITKNKAIKCYSLQGGLTRLLKTNA